MELLIFGATGSIDRKLVQQALDQRYQVTAFVRDPAKLSIEHMNLEIVQDNVKAGVRRLICQATLE